MESKLLDMRNCQSGSFRGIYKEILKIHLLQQPRWFRPLLMKNRYLQKLVDYNYWARAWEYPWAIIVAKLQGRCLDVGGGGSPFAIYLAQNGHDSYVIDPSLNQGQKFSWNQKRGIYRNIGSWLFSLVLKILKIRRIWALQAENPKNSVSYHSYSATEIKFPDGYFDRVFCLSVMEHIPEKFWEQCIKEFERVLKPGGRLIITLDMSSVEANKRLYLKLVNSCKLRLIGNPYYEVPISKKDKQIRHPDHTYETIGLVWQG